MATTRKKKVNLIERKKIIRILSEEYTNKNKSEIEETDNLYSDLNLSSLQSIELLVEIEDMFSVNIPEKDWEQIRTIEDVYTTIESNL